MTSCYKSLLFYVALVEATSIFCQIYIIIDRSFFTRYKSHDLYKFAKKVTYILVLSVTEKNCHISNTRALVDNLKMNVQKLNMNTNARVRHI